MCVCVSECGTRWPTTRSSPTYNYDACALLILNGYLSHSTHACASCVLYVPFRSRALGNETGRSICRRKRLHVTILIKHVLAYILLEALPLPTNPIPMPFRCTKVATPSLTGLGAACRALAGAWPTWACMYLRYSDWYGWEIGGVGMRCGGAGLVRGLVSHLVVPRRCYLIAQSMPESGFIRGTD